MGIVGVLLLVVDIVVLVVDFAVIASLLQNLPVILDLLDFLLLIFAMWYVTLFIAFIPFCCRT